MSSPVLRIMALEKKVEELQRLIDSAIRLTPLEPAPNGGDIVPAKRYRPVGTHKGIN